TNLTLKDFQSITRVLIIYRCFKLASGATLKEAKNQLLLLGSATAEEVPQQLRDFIVNKLKIYGFTITAEGFDDEENWQEVQDALDLQEYKVPTIELSHYGKVGTFMTYTLSKMWYRSNLITPTPQIINKLERVLDGYLWYPSAGKHHVRKGVLKLPVEEGGIAYPDVLMRVRAIRVQTLMRRYKDTEQTWHNVFDFYRDKLKNLTKAQLIRDFSVPNLYKEIREAEIACNLQINNDDFTIFGLPISANVKLRYICYLMSTNKFSKDLVKTTTFWSEHF
ncbi:MAG: hypothetical protein GY858_05150, partial [Candidatus Omnitrophica bacterium]|nr:hypothetical protein [Candidatus Omnitrophota bacterium]